MRILIVPRDFPSSEEPVAGIFVLRQLQELRKLGHEISVLRIVPKVPPLPKRKHWQAVRRIPERYEREGIAVRCVRALVPPQLRGIGFVRRQFAPHLRAAIAEFKPNVVHAWCTIPTAALCTGIETPLVVTAPGSDTYLEPWSRRDLEMAARAALREAAVAVAVSGFVAEAVRRLGRRDCRVVFMGADEAVFFPRERTQARSTLQIENGRNVIMFTGALIKEKGIFDLAQALALVRDLRPLALIADDGPGREELRARLDESRVDYRLLGRIPQPELATALAAADAFTLPTYAEGLPNAVCEAMMAGRAVVATRAGGIPEIITDGETGLLVQPGEPEELAAALRRVLNDAGLRTAIESNAREFAVRELTWAHHAKQYEEIYREAMGQSSPR